MFWDAVPKLDTLLPLLPLLPLLSLPSILSEVWGNQPIGAVATIGQEAVGGRKTRMINIISAP